MAFKGAGELCTCIEAKAADFNYVNVTTAFRQLLKMARQAGVRQSALQVLEDVMMRKMGDFGPREVASTLHIMAKARYRPKNRALLPALDMQVEKVVREYDAQAVANTVWAYATMGREPGEGVMGMLEGRMGEVVGEYNAQDVANTMWAACVLSECSAQTLVQTASRLSGCLSSLTERIDDRALSQLHQVFLTCRLEEGLRARMPPAFVELEERLGPACLQAFVSGPARTSESQRDVKRALERMGLPVEEEARCPRSGYSIDMLVREKGTAVPSEGGGPGGRGGRQWAVEFDGPSHFVGRGSPTGATLLKRRHLRLLGYALVSVPYWEWDEVRGGEGDGEEYLRARLYVGGVRPDGLPI